MVNRLLGVAALYKKAQESKIFGIAPYRCETRPHELAMKVTSVDEHMRTAHLAAATEEDLQNSHACRNHS